jgi:hypothetical protein
MDSKKTALVTGVSSGIGQAIASELAASGWRVYGSVRRPDAEVPSGVERVALDVRDQASIDKAIGEILERSGRLDLLVNNAGASIVGAIEETDTAQAQALFDVNFFGAVRVTQAVLPAMRKQRSGRVLFISSVVGFLPAPYMGFYAASAFMKTRIDQNAARAQRPIDDYRDARERVGASINASVERAEDPRRVAEAVRKAAEAERPRLRYPVGKGAAMLARLRSLMPSGLFDRSLRKEFHVDG